MQKLQAKEKTSMHYVYISSQSTSSPRTLSASSLGHNTHTQKRKEKSCARVRDQSHTAMSGGAEMIAGAVVQRLAGMLGDKAWERVELLWNFKEDVEGMERIMIDLKLALSYADKRSRESDGRDELVQPWLTRYKSVAYDIEDALDELVANATIWENSKCTVRI